MELFIKSRSSSYIKRVLQSIEFNVLKEIRYEATGDMTILICEKNGFQYKIHHHKNCSRLGFEGDILTIELNSSPVEEYSHDELQMGLSFIENEYINIANITKGILTHSNDEALLFGYEEDDTEFLVNLYRSNGGNMEKINKVIEDLLKDKTELTYSIKYKNNN